jgi:hypothetical protein
MFGFLRHNIVRYSPYGSRELVARGKIMSDPNFLEILLCVGSNVKNKKSTGFSSIYRRYRKCLKVIQLPSLTVVQPLGSRLRLDYRRHRHLCLGVHGGVVRGKHYRGLCRQGMARRDLPTAYRQTGSKSLNNLPV